MRATISRKIKLILLHFVFMVYANVIAKVSLVGAKIQKMNDFLYDIEFISELMIIIYFDVNLRMKLQENIYLIRLVVKSLKRSLNDTINYKISIHNIMLK